MGITVTHQESIILSSVLMKERERIQIEIANDGGSRINTDYIALQKHKLHRVETLLGKVIDEKERMKRQRHG